MAKSNVNVTDTTKVNGSAGAGMVKKTFFGIQEGTTKTLIATWQWAKPNTDHYEVTWKSRLRVADNLIVWRTDQHNTGVTDTNSTFHIPDDAKAVMVIIKPIAKNKTVNNVETPYWTATNTTEDDWTYWVEEVIQGTMNKPSVSLDKYTLTAEISDITLPITSVQFEVIKDHSDGPAFKTTNIPITSAQVSTTWTIDAGSVYKVRCRGCKDGVYTEWSSYSNVVTALPKVPVITKIDVIDENTVDVTWSKVNNAKSYTLQYMAKASIPEGLKDKTLTELFTYSNIAREEVSVESPTENKDSTITYALTKLASGSEYYIRLLAVNTSSTPSEGSELREESLKSFIIGTKPTSPTTWSTTTTAVIGEMSGDLNLYWLHNSEDGSILTQSELILTINGEQLDPIVLGNIGYEDQYISVDTYDRKKEVTRVCRLKTNNLVVGSKIKWKVRTAGVLKDSNGDPVYGDYSIERTIDVYTPPVLSVQLQDGNGIGLDISSTSSVINHAVFRFSSFPLRVVMNAGNTANQNPIGYYLNILAVDDYTVVNEVGESQTVIAGEKVYSNYFNSNNNVESVDIMPSDASFQNNITYQVVCTVAMSSGLTAESMTYFKTGWSEVLYQPLAEVGVNKDDLTTYIRPYIYDEENEKELHLNGVFFSVFRREYDGTYTEIERDIPSAKNSYVVDPHPSLDYARYRVTAYSRSTGGVSFSDIPAVPVNEKAVIIQWDERWQSFDVTDTTAATVVPHSGSLLRLPYNIDVSYSNDPDVSLVEYAGRKHPVSYYGTQLREKMTWNVDIPHDDVETLFAIRRLQIWMGNVYVREPSGCGYWANIKVNYSKRHLNYAIPISFDITRVEGGK